MVIAQLNPISALHLLSDKQQEVDLHSLRSQQEESLDNTPTNSADAAQTASAAATASGSAVNAAGSDNKSGAAAAAAIGSSKPAAGSESGAGTDEINAMLSADILVLKHNSSFLIQSSNPVQGDTSVG